MFSEEAFFSVPLDLSLTLIMCFNEILSTVQSKGGRLPLLHGDLLLLNGGVCV